MGAWLPRPPERVKMSKTRWGSFGHLQNLSENSQLVSGALHRQSGAAFRLTEAKHAPKLAGVLLQLALADSLAHNGRAAQAEVSPHPPQKNISEAKPK